MKQEKEDKIQWWQFDSLSPVIKNISEKGLLWVSIAGINITIIALWLVVVFAGSTISARVNSYVDLKKTELTNTYELQKESLNYLKLEIKPQLDNIIKRLDNTENRVSSLEQEVTNIKKNIQDIQIENNIMHPYYK